MSGGVRDLKFDIIARDRATRTMDDVGDASDTLGGQLSRFGGIAVSALAGAATAAAGLATAGVVMGVKTAAGLEQAEIAFTTLLKSGEKAEAFLADLKAFAAKTPFELPGLIQSARQLIGVGQAADKVIPTLEAWGDAAGALGLNQEQFERAMLATTQAMAKGKVQAEELMQITEAGIPIYPLLAKAMGKTVPEIQKMGEQGKLLAKDVFPALERQMKKDYGGAMAAQSKTLTGLWSTFMDTLNIGLAEAVMPFADGMKNGLAGATDTAARALKGLQTAAGSIKSALDGVDLSGIVSKVKGAGGGIKTAAKGWAGSVLDGIKEGVKTGDWSGLGKTLGEGLAKGIGAVGDLAAHLGKWAASVDWVEVGKKVGGKAIGFAVGFLSGLGADLFTAEFWKKHWWDVIVAVLTIIPVGKLLGVLGKLFAKIPILKALAPLMKSFDSLVDPLWRGLLGTLKWLGKKLVEGIRLIFPNFGKEVGKLFGRGGFLDHIALLFLEWGPKLGRMALNAILFIPTWIVKGSGALIAGAVKLIGFLLRPFATAGVWLLKRGLEVVRGLGSGILMGIRLAGYAAMSVIRAATAPFVTAGRWLVAAGQRIITGLVGGIRQRLGTIWSVVSGIGSRIGGQFARAGSWLYNAGKSIVQGLINGIANKAGALLEKVKELARKVRDYWPFSPAKTGPLSGKGDLKYAGEGLVERLADGVNRGVSALTGAVSNAAGSVTPAAAGPSAGLGARTGGEVITLRVVHESPDGRVIREELLKHKRQARLPVLGLA